MVTIQDDPELTAEEQGQGFAEKYGVTMTATPAPKNPNMNAGEKWEAYHYAVTIQRGRASLAAFYSVGVGIVERFIEEDAARNLNRKIGAVPVCGPDSYRPMTARDWVKNHRLRYGAEQYNTFRDAVAEKYFRPDVMDVLASLISDAQTIENAPRFADWCAELGYDADSIKARKTFDLILEQSAELRALLGREAYAELAEGV